MFLINFMSQLRKHLNKNFHAMGNNNSFERYSMKKAKNTLTEKITIESIFHFSRHYKLR